MPDMSFADALRSVARLKPLVASGVLGAAVACSLAVGAMAAERPTVGIEDREVNVLGAEADMHKESAEFYAKGVLTIAQTDFSRMSPRDAVATMRSMARATLEAGPEISNFASADTRIASDPDSRVKEALARTSSAYSGATMIRAFVDRLTSDKDLTPGKVREEAPGVVQAALRDLKSGGIEISPTAQPFAGVEAEMKQTVENKVAALRKIAGMIEDSDPDPIDAVEAALSGERDMQPARRTLLGRLAADAIRDPGVSFDTKVALIKGIAMSQAADGAFEAIVRQSKEDGTDVDAKRMAVVAGVALGSISYLETAKPEASPSPR